MALQSPVFPIDQPVMPEERQIGRKPAIDALQHRLQATVHQWLIDDRRTGKTSVAKAVLERWSTDGGLAIGIDLSRSGLDSDEGIAREIARQIEPATVSAIAKAGRRASTFAKTHRKEARGFSRGLEKLGHGNTSTALDAVSAALAEAATGKPDLDDVLDALAIHATAVEHRAVILLDEVQLLARVPRAVTDFARICRLQDCPILLLLTGSEESAVRALRERGKPLAAIGEEFDLAEIAFEDWVPGLRDRFEEAGVKIDKEQLLEILGTSGGQPRRTMLVCEKVRTIAGDLPGAVATPVVVELAIQHSKKDRSWL